MTQFDFQELLNVSQASHSLASWATSWQSESILIFPSSSSFFFCGTICKSYTSKRTIYLSFAVKISVTHTIVFHLVLEHTIHIRKLELGNKKSICRKTIYHSSDCHINTLTPHSARVALTVKFCHKFIICKQLKENSTTGFYNWRARWKKGVSDDLRLKSKLLLFSWTLAHRLVFMWGTPLRTYFLTWDLKFEELAYYFCLKLT